MIYSLKHDTRIFSSLVQFKIGQNYSAGTHELVSGPFFIVDLQQYYEHH